MFYINKAERRYHVLYPTDRTCNLKRNNAGSYSSSTRFKSRQGPSIFTEILFSTLFAISRDNAASITTGYTLEGNGVEVRVPVRARFPPLRIVQAGSGVHPAFYPMGNEGCFSRGWSGRGMKLTIQLKLVPRSRIRESIHQLPHTSSWNSA
jgi:hypothetical protein